MIVDKLKIERFVNNNYSQDLVDKASKIELLAFDVDGVITDGGIYIDHNGNESKRFYAQDGHGIKIVQSINIKTVIISGRSSVSVDHRGVELGINQVIQGSRDKLKTFKDNFVNIDRKSICYVGDDTVDIELLDYSGLSIIVPNSNKLLLEYQFDWVTPRSGGYGALRDVCDLIYYSKYLKNESNT